MNEFVVAGLLISPLVKYALIAALIVIPIRFVLLITRLQRWFWHPLLAEAAKQALKNPGADTLLLRRSYPELEASLLAQFRRDVPRSHYKSYNEAKHLVTWRNGSTTRVGY